MTTSTNFRHSTHHAPRTPVRARENTHTTSTHATTTITAQTEKTVTSTEIAPIFTVLHADLQNAIKRVGFTTPTPIQQSAIPLAMNGRDILASSMTGSGKTAAFLLPIMHRIIASRENEKQTTGRITPKIRALILTPTRELAAQICQHFNDLAQCSDLSCAAIFGGVSMLPQERAFRHSVDIMVATPGRLLDHCSREYGKMPHLEYLVLDEADRMLDMGFLPDIRRVMKVLPARPRQTLLFSATLPAPIVVLAKDMLNNPASVDIERPQITATGIEHKAFKVADNLKQELLINIIDQHQIRSAIIFTRTKHRAKRLAQFLDRKNVATDCIHGNRSQLQRTKALEDFRNGKVRVLVATDIASRGIDVEAISHVINFDVPHIVDDYVHRAGRTARANMTGYSFTLVSADEMYDFGQIERTIKTRIEHVKLENFDYNARPAEALEIPMAQRIAEIRAYKAACRNRAAAKTQRTGQQSATTRTQQPADPRPQRTHQTAATPRPTRTYRKY
ncbi:MAG: RNA helicase [Candidatus Riflebacteria bacterium HGW-Riflebacteria-1]|nr:MAG: RNA helicase [Candidatus Riflebacteria bacterium HGW-Riflebacteria-1]